MIINIIIFKNIKNIKKNKWIFRRFCYLLISTTDSLPLMSSGNTRKWFIGGGPNGFQLTEFRL